MFKTQTPSPSHLRRARLSIETLEDRRTPATFTVGTLLDTVNSDNVLSLREAITFANITPGPDTLLLPAGKLKITRGGLDNTNDRGDFDVTGSLTLRGQGQGTTIIEGLSDRSDRLFDLLGTIDVAFENLTLQGGGSGTNLHGGAVQALTANVTLTNVLATGNRASKGGAINAENGTVTLQGSRVADNSSSGLGGGIHARFVTATNSTVTANSAATDGGGLYATHTATLTDSTVTGNTAQREGGGVYAFNTARLLRATVLGNKALGATGFGGGGVTTNAFLTDSTVRDNTAANGAGVAATVASLVNTRVIGNTATLLGGGVFSHTTATLSGGEVTGNTAGSDGGGIRAKDVTLTNVSVTGNTAKREGGGLYAFNTATLTRTTVSGNHALAAAGFGGGVVATNAFLTDSTVSGNDAANGAGVAATSASLTRTTVSDNTAKFVGGGVFAHTAASFTASTVSGNRAGTDGGGIKAKTVNLTNSTISGNIANGNGGGVHTANGTFLNATIVRNEAGFLGTGFGGGVFGGTANVKNTIVALNRADGQVDLAGFFLSQGNNLIGDGNGGNGATGFIDGVKGDQVGTPGNRLDPKIGALAFNGGLTRTHALLAGSRAIDRGNNTGAPATDQRGLARVKDGDGNRSLVVDIGAFEL